MLTPEETLAKYITAINQDTFDPDENPHAYLSEDYTIIRPFFTRLFCIPTTSTPVERMFSQGA